MGGHRVKEELTEEQKQQVQRLLKIHYTRGVVDAAKSLSETFQEFGATTEVAVEALTNLLKWAEDNVTDMEVEEDEVTD